MSAAYDTAMKHLRSAIDEMCHICGHRPDQHGTEGCTALPFGATCGCPTFAVHPPAST